MNILCNMNICLMIWKHVNVTNIQINKSGRGQILFKITLTALAQGHKTNTNPNFTISFRKSFWHLLSDYIITIKMIFYNNKLMFSATAQTLMALQAHYIKREFSFTFISYRKAYGV